MERSKGSPQPKIERRNSEYELVSALSPPSRQYPSSAPSTPVAKAVRFDDSQLEKVRHFFRLDEPLAVGNIDEGDNFDLAHCWRENEEPSWQPRRGEVLTITLVNFPMDTASRRMRVVRLEDVRLSMDGFFLLGSVSVANLTYHKHVACRFTLDDWRTIHEIKAHYAMASRTKHTPEGYDSFLFSIDLRDFVGLRSKTLRCCIRCNTGGCEYWDNNEGANFDILFGSATLTRSW